MIAVYARVSTEEQAKHGFSLQDQIRACREKAASTEILEYVDDGVSGEFLNRPALTRLRQDIRTGDVREVVCLDPDRLSRKLIHQLILSDEIEQRVALVFVNGEYTRTPEGQLFYQLRGAISQFEKAKINERMSRGRREKARQGRVLRDFHIYGYDFDEETERLVTNEREAMVVRLVFDQFTSPDTHVHGISGIARYLTALGIPTKRGGRTFHRQVVRQMLMNRTYVGEFYQNKWNTEGMMGNRFRPIEERIAQTLRPRDEWIRIDVPVIVEPTTFEHAQVLLAEARRRWAGTSKRTYLLGGLVRCGDCGRTMTGRSQRVWGKSVCVYRDGARKAHEAMVVCSRVVPCDRLERSVWQAVLAWLERMGDIEGVLQRGGPDARGKLALAAVEQQALVKWRLLEARLIDLLDDPEIDPVDIHARLKEVQTRRRHLEQTRGDDVAGGDTDAESDSGHIRQAWYLLRTAPWNAIPDVCKRQLIRTVVREVRVHDAGQRVEVVTF